MVGRSFDRDVSADTEAVASAEAQKEHGEALVIMTPLADLFALVEDRACNAIPGPFARRFLKVGIGAVEGSITGFPKRLGLLAVPLVQTYLRTGLVPRFPTAIVWRM